ncbi:lycopene cyclase domain-containing protein [bacterium SCSIO 12741]|nr:lycopene cyclase domain-containing protein [bacterium SCSIO 12741]
MESYLYLLVNVFTIGMPLALSFDKKVHFRQYFPTILKALLWVAIPFIIWDILFTHYGIWGFNERYLIGIGLAGLPLEEILFFFTAPFACLFIYECLNAYFGTSRKSLIYRALSFAWALLILPLTLIHYDDVYTLFATGLTVLTLVWIGIQNASWTGQFYVSFAVSLIPFILVNSLLTGSWIEEEIVWYNRLETQGANWGTIPLEDFFYCFILLFWNTWFFERFKPSSPKS